MLYQAKGINMGNNVTSKEVKVQRSSIDKIRTLQWTGWI